MDTDEKDAVKTGEPEKQKRAHHRSPSYPMLSLDRALEKARLIYNEDKRSFTSRAVILRHLGYKDEKNGYGNRELAALKQYGLLEEKSGEFRISDAAHNLLFLSDASPEKRNRLEQCALAPGVFRELWGKYADEASDTTLADFLIHSRGFNPASVEDVVSTYRKTMAFAKPTAVTYTEASLSDDAEDEQMTDSATQIQHQEDAAPGTLRDIRSSVNRAPNTQKQPEISTPVGTQSDGEVVFAHVRFDAGIRKDFVLSLKKYLEYLETTLPA